MSPRATPWIAAGIAALASAGFAWFVRLPLPFPGFSALAAAFLALVGTLALMACMPRQWVWTEAERLRMAFQARHGVSDSAAGMALGAITTTHARAESLRRSAAVMQDDIAEEVERLADRLDTAAREIFYAPDRQRGLRNVLVRSELIEEAAAAHAALRRRKHAPTEDLSRDKLSAALVALDAAFDQTDLLAARGLLQEVEVASDVAERLLTPRRQRDATLISKPST
ncbi:hypothetical protein AADZ90_019450 [Aestuariibius sp. 2305UL40-4]|uniref:hypothetical protein n=1 Tax=Aestuariibius violaceus TaxID=3234132 RepID=UPI00345EDF2D